MSTRSSTRQKVAVVAGVAVLLILVILVKQGQRTASPDSEPVSEAEPVASADTQSSPSSLEETASKPSAASDTENERQTPPGRSQTAQAQPTSVAKPTEASPEQAEQRSAASNAPVKAPAELSKQESPPTPKRLPKLVDVGAGECIPCKMMAPILQELEKEYAGRLGVEFVDVWKNPSAADEYGTRVIPTQIFYDTAGKEFYRHEGFFSKEDILGVFRDQEIDV